MEKMIMKKKIYNNLKPNKMKKNVIFILTLMINTISFSQLELVKETKPPYNYDEYRTSTYLSNGDKIYFNISQYDRTFNKYLNEFSLYKNYDSLYKKIKLPSRKDSIKYTTSECSLIFPTYSKLGSLEIKSTTDQDLMKLLITDKFYNNDSKIEFLVQVREFNNSSLDKDQILSRYLMNEDGNILHTFPVINTAESIGGIKIGYVGNYLTVAYYNRGSVSDTIIKTDFYKINGLINCQCNCSSNNTSTTANLEKMPEPKKLNLSSYPNPNSGKATIVYELPENTSKGNIRFYSQQGDLLKTYTVNNQQTELEISTDEYSTGIYFYELESNGYASGGKKMIVIK
jgi:hypothetical protein